MFDPKMVEAVHVAVRDMLPGAYASDPERRVARTALSILCAHLGISEAALNALAPDDAGHPRATIMPHAMTLAMKYAWLSGGPVLETWGMLHAASPFAAKVKGGGDASFQSRVGEWMLHCFGAVIAADRTERNHRFIEEALELVQSAGCTQSEAHQLVDYVFGRPVGELAQEVGGVMVTLAALCSAHGADMAAAAETELTRVWIKADQIRAKQAAKPKHSPLPEAVKGGGDA